MCVNNQTKQIGWGACQNGSGTTVQVYTVPA
jgi:hypothetical protein